MLLRTLPDAGLAVLPRSGHLTNLEEPELFTLLVERFHARSDSRRMVGMPWDKRDDMIVHGADPFNAEPPPAALAHAPLTPHEAFYVRNHGPVPDVAPSAWRLRVDGTVDREHSWSLDELRAGFAAHDVVATMQCAGNRRAGLIEVRDIPGQAPWGPGATSTARWTGVRLAEVLDACGAGHEDGHVEFTGLDVSEGARPPQPFGASIPLGKARSPEVLLAWAMNGADLPPVHGAPVRVVVPGYIGARSVKWVDRITVRDTPSENWFQHVAYRLQPADADPADAGPGSGFPLGAVSLNSAVLVPDDGARVPAGPTTVHGYALAGGDREIVRLEVSTDGGRTWRQAELGEQQGKWSWRLWSATVDLAPGPVTVTARAWDTSATVQPESAAQLWNPGGYANNAWARVDLTAV